MKCLLVNYLLLLFILFSTDTNGQTYITPLVGVGLINMQQEGIDLHYRVEIPDEYSTTTDLLFGVLLEKRVSNRFLMNLSPVFSQKRIMASVPGILGNNGIMFNYWRLSIGTKYNIKTFKIGIDFNIQLISNLDTFPHEGHLLSADSENRKQMGASLTLIYFLKEKITFEGRYNYAITYFGEYEYSDLFNPINSISLSVGYTISW